MLCVPRGRATVQMSCEFGTAPHLGSGSRTADCSNFKFVKFDAVDLTLLRRDSGNRGETLTLKIPAGAWNVVC